MSRTESKLLSPHPRGAGVWAPHGTTTLDNLVSNDLMSSITPKKQVHHVSAQSLKPAPSLIHLPPACTDILIFGIMHIISCLYRPHGLDTDPLLRCTPSVVDRKLMEGKRGFL